EPDPLARWLLHWRLPHVRLELEHRDSLLGPLLNGSPGLDALLARRPRASVLFCNLLGQLHWDLPDEQQQQFRSELERRVLPLLASRSWASFHDRWSIELEAPQAETLPPMLRFERRPSDDELGAAYFGAEGA